MDCQTVRTMIDVIPSGSPDWRSVDGLAASQHLSECPACQLVSAEASEVDERIGLLMASVPVPEELRERLLAVATPAAATPQTAGRPWKRWAAAALSLCLVLGFGVSLWWSQPGQFTVTEWGQWASDRLNSPAVASLGEFDGAFDAQLVDPRWKSVCDGPAMGWDVDGRPGHDLAAYRVRIEGLRMTGWLIVIPADRVSNLPESNAPGKIAYTQAAWRNETQLLICVSDRAGIERLVAAWSQSAA